MNDSMQTVYIVDDDAAVRDALSMLLESVDIPCMTFAAADEFLAAYSSDDSGCLVLDIRMPGMSGLELQARLNEEHCTLPIIFITGHGDIPMAVEAMRRGALDFIRKPFRDQELLDRINEALQTESGIRNENRFQQEVMVKIESLTAREAEIFNRIAEGEANKVVAIELGISERTVEVHRSNVMKKIGARSLADLVKAKLLTSGLGV